MSRPLAIFFALTIGVVLCAFGGILFLMHELGWRDHVRDEVLMRDLETHADRYEELIEMYREDSPASIIHPTWMSPENVITDSRWEEYKTIFRELGIDGGMRTRFGGGLWFISTVQGFSFHGSSKGYLYSPEEEPSPQYPNLDELLQDSRGMEYAYRKINDDWFLVVDLH